MAQVVLSPIGQPLCAWTQDSRKFAIHANPDVLARLGMEVRVASKRVPRRGLEIGGIILGRANIGVDSTTFWIEGFQSIDSEHQSGPSYILSQCDFALFEEALTKNGATSIGIYRSHTRSQQLSVQETDVQLFQRCFDVGDAPFLMACPLSAKAAFFFPDDGELKCVYEFDLGSPSPSVAVTKSPPEIQGAWAAVPSPMDPTPPFRQHSPGLLIKGKLSAEGNSSLSGTRIGIRFLGWLRRGLRVKKEVWLVAAMVFSLVLGAGVGMLTHSHAPSMNPQRLPAEVLHLKVDGNGGLLRVHWDQNSFTIHDPSRVVLHIQDGNYQIDRTLVLSEFRGGSVTYEPKSREVTFRMDVSSPTANATGLVQVVNLSAQPAIAQTWPAEIVPKKSPGYSPAESYRSQTSVERTEAAPAIPVARVQNTEDLRPAAFRSAEGAETASVRRRDSEPALEAAKEARSSIVERTAIPSSVQRLSVRVWAEPVAGSRLARLVGKVPLVRRLRKQAVTLGPIPIFQAQPVLTDPANDSITRPVSVDVKVSVGESGTVKDAQVIDFGDPLRVSLANSALAAARHWTFEPARIEDLPASSKVILHFRFTP